MAVAVFIFHRDLRLIDNTGLLAAAEQGYTIIPIFVFTPEQIDPRKNRYFSNAAVQFMCESLVELNADLESHGSRLFMYRGDTVSVLEKIAAKVPYTAVFQNMDTSVYAQKRDRQIALFCKKTGKVFVNTEDYDLVSSSEGLLPDGRPYTVLSQYFARFQKDVAVRKPNLKNVATFLRQGRRGGELGDDRIDLNIFYTKNENIVQKGGRAAGLQRLGVIDKYRDYNKNRDFPAQDATTKLSAYIKFGVVSIREVYHKIASVLGPTHGLIRELVFRSFYMKIFSYNPKLQRGTAYRSDMDQRIPWVSKTAYWKAWTTGTTGYPLCDAGMRQLAKEAWVHNRVRMILASVASRYLFIDWREASRYFYQHLVDADTFSNTAGWQWAAGIGPDAAPYFRAPFNPFIQSRKFDKSAEYIKRYIPELVSVDPAHIHRWNEDKIRALYPDVSYPAPIVQDASKHSIAVFKKAYQG